MGEEAEAPSRVRHLWMQPGVRALLFWLYGIPLAGNLNVVLSITTRLWHYSRGDTVESDPLLRIWMAVSIIGTIIAGWTLGIATIVKWRKVPLLLWSGIAALLLSLSPAWVAGRYYFWFMELRGLEWLKFEFRIGF